MSYPDYVWKNSAASTAVTVSREESQQAEHSEMYRCRRNSQAGAPFFAATGRAAPDSVAQPRRDKSQKIE